MSPAYSVWDLERGECQRAGAPTWYQIRGAEPGVGQTGRRTCKKALERQDSARLILDLSAQFKCTAVTESAV